MEREINQEELFRRARLYVDCILANGATSITLWPFWPKGTRHSVYTWNQLVLAGILGYDLETAKTTFSNSHIKEFPTISDLEKEAVKEGWKVYYANPDDWKITKEEKEAAKHSSK